MHTFQELVQQLDQKLTDRIFPGAPATLYGPAQYIMGQGGKRLRPVLCLMGNELFGSLHPQAFDLAVAVELFHNFTLVHDDIMDEAPLRRGKPTVHERFGPHRALLAGDVMMVLAYEQLNRVQGPALTRILAVFNKAAREVCEGQQLDMDFAALAPEAVSMDAYLHMIALKTSVLLAASLQMGGILGGGSEGNLQHLYEFGRNLGMAFQIHDDLLDAFGDPKKFGKQPGGDILENKKTFLLLKAFELCGPAQKARMQSLLAEGGPEKVEAMLAIYRECAVEQWAMEERQRFVTLAETHLDQIAVLSSRKKALQELVPLLLKREN